MAATGARRSAPSAVAWYLGVGVFSYAIDLGILSLCYEVFGWPLWLATVTGFWITFFVNFGLNRRFTFQAQGRNAPQLVRYGVLVAFNLAATVVIVWVAEWAGIGYFPGKTAAVGALAIVNFIAFRMWVFR